MIDARFFMARRSLLIVAAVLVAFAATLFVLGWKSAGNAAKEQGLGYSSETVGGDFTLTSADGPVALKGMRGSVVLLFFGYTSCPAACPTTLTMVKEALARLDKKEADRVRILFITIDPERDSAQKLKEYVAYFHPNIIGLTGSRDEIVDVADQYGVLFFKEEVADSALGYTFLHDTRIRLVTPEGSLGEAISHDTMPEEMAQRIRSYLGAGRR